jgi:Flp pilus assembly protein TadD
MKRTTLIKMAASTIFIGATLTSCGGSGTTSVASASSVSQEAKKAPKYAAKAEKAMAKSEWTTAVSFAEMAVAADPQNAGYRASLAQAYFSSGRFASAERSFLDAMELGQVNARVILSLAMSQLAQGKANKAASLVREHAQILPGSDYGLALALAGETKDAVQTLEASIRSDMVDGRTRQNLALAYALDGRWKEAKLMAMQDMTPAVVDQSMMQWALMARPGAYETRVASLLKITPDRNDPGQPVRLALNANPAAPVYSASASNSYEELASVDRNAPLPAIGPAPVAGERVDFASASPAPVFKTADIPASKTAPVVAASSQPVKVAANDKFIVEQAGKPSVAPRPVTKPAPATPAPVAKAPAPAPVVAKLASASPAPVASGQKVAAGTHLVQLGAFSSADSAKQAWNKFQAQYSGLKDYSFASSVTTVNGTKLYRLAAIGFESGSAANAVCSGIKAKGGSCIVRQAEGGAVQMASAKPKTIASR